MMYRKADRRAAEAAELERVIKILMERHGCLETEGKLMMEVSQFWHFVDEVISLARGATLIR